MRNLKLVDRVSHQISLSTQESIVQFACDRSTGTLFFLTSNINLLGIDIDNFQILFQTSLLDADLFSEDVEVIDLQYIPDLESLCLASKSGDLILFNITEKQAECVGTVDSGILAISWSPDFELVVMATGNNSVLCMSKDWDIVTEVSLLSSPPSPSHSLPPRISWREDGNFFVCNVFDPEKGRRVLKVWERSCVYHSTSEESSTGLGSYVSCRPTGNIIATSQRLPQKHDIVFFERNGLRRGEFSLRPDTEKFEVSSIHWSCDSETLLIILVSGDESIAQFWTTGNFHWYLKQEFRMAGKVSNVLWDSENPLVVRFVSVSGVYSQFSFCFDHDISRGFTSSNQTTIAVIDGSKIHLTPLRKMIPPPPMSAAQLQLESPVLAVSFGASQEFAIQLSNASIAFYHPYYSSSHQNPSPSKLPTRYSLIRGGKALDFQRVRHLELVNANTWLCVESKEDGSPDSSDNLIHARFSEKESVLEASALKIERISLSKRVLRLCPIHDSNSYLIQFVDGSLSRYQLDSHRVQDKIYKPLPSPCLWMSSVKMAGEETTIALSTANKLYINGAVASSECYSYSLHDRFLLFTTISHQLRLLPLSLKFDDPKIEARIGSAYDDTTREIERGGRLVSAISEDARVILQMPRGNLEIIVPRALVLSIARSLINALKYSDAFILLRKHRVDLNFLYDHNPSEFLVHSREFIEQIANVDHLNLFLSSLNEKDVTKTLYVDIEEQTQTVSTPTINTNNSTNKANLICSTLRNHLQQINKEKYLLSILTTYMKSSPPELEEVLLVIKQLRDNPSIENAALSFDKALSYVIFLADVVKMYEVALGMYDFDLASVIAQKSNMDPKEYLPFLRKLQGMDKYYQQYSVDMHLNKFGSALKNLSQCGDEFFPDCLELIKNQKLFTLALQIYDNKPELNTILHSFADYLVENKHYKDAALAYEQCEEYSEALHCYQKGGEWKEALVLANKLEYGPEELRGLANKLADTLINSSRHSEAAVVLLDYSKDVERAISSLLSASSWSEALRIGLLHSVEGIETQVKDSVHEAYEANFGLLTDKKQLFSKLATRLTVVRENKRLLPLLVGETGSVIGDNPSEVSFSDRSSVVSTSSSSAYSTQSGSSRRSSVKARNKKPKKRLSGREGNPHEEEYLVTTLRSTLAFLTADFLAEQQQLLKWLLRFNFRQEAANLRSSVLGFTQVVNQFTQLVLDSERDVFNPSDPVTATPCFVPAFKWDSFRQLH